MIDIQTKFLITLLLSHLFIGSAFSGEVNIPPYSSSNRSWYQSQCEGWSVCSNNNCGPTSYAMAVYYVTGMFFGTYKGSDETCTPKIPQSYLDSYPSLETEARWRGADDAYNPNGPLDGWKAESDDGTFNWEVENALANEGIESHSLSGEEVYIGQSRENDIDLSLIKEAIDESHLVIAHVNACYYREEGQKCATSHWTLIYGYNDSNSLFYTNVPGYNYETSVTYNEMKNAMENAYGGNDEVLIIIDEVSLGIGFYSEGVEGWIQESSQKFVDAYKKNLDSRKF